MTAIIGLKDKDTIYIGGDSCGVAGLSVSVRDDVKVFENGSFIIGGTTSFRMLQLLNFKFNPPKQTDKQSDMEYMVGDFIDSVRELFKNNGFGSPTGNGGEFLVGYNGTLYSIGSDYQVGVNSFQYDAVGCGSDLCLGSLHSTAGMKSLKPEERITMALKAASQFSGGVCEPFRIVSQKPFKRQQALKFKTAAKTANKAVKKK